MARIPDVYEARVLFRGKNGRDFSLGDDEIQAAINDVSSHDVTVYSIYDGVVNMTETEAPITDLKKAQERLDAFRAEKLDRKFELREDEQLISQADAEAAVLQLMLDKEG